MERPSGSKSPPSNGNFFTPDFFTTLPVFAITVAVGGVLCLLFLLRRRFRRQMQSFLPPSATAAANLSATTEKVSVASAVTEPLPFSSVAAGSPSSPPFPPVFLDKSRKRMRLQEKHAISPDTHRFRFSLEDPRQSLGLPIGKHLKLFAPTTSAAATFANGRSSGEGGNGVTGAAEGEEIERKYTPVTGDEAKGYVDLVVKVYRRGEDPRFPDGGTMSQYLHTLQPGQYVDVQGPVGRIEYLGSGSFTVSRKTLPPKKNIGMLSGGTGITPMYQLISAITNNPSDSTSLTLLYANKTEADILLKTELDALVEKHSDQLQVYYTVAAASPSWPFFKGFIDKRMIEQTMPPPASNVLILVCGSPVMVACCKRDLLELGYAKEDILDF